jgi:hypothetical protein
MPGSSSDISSVSPTDGPYFPARTLARPQMTLPGQRISLAPESCRPAYRPIHPAGGQPAPSSDGSRRRPLPLVREIVRYGDALVRTRRPLLAIAVANQQRAN